MSIDLSQLNVYTNPLKTLRLSILAQNLNQQQFTQQILPKLEENGLYLAAYNLVTTILKQQYSNEELIIIRRILNEKRTLCQQAKNQQNRNALKQLHVDLGDLYLKYGDLNEAYNAYFKAHENNSTQEALDYANSWTICMILSNNYMHYKVINVNPKDKDQIGYQKWLLLSAIRNYVRMDYKNFLNDLLSIDNQLLPKVDFITCYEDLSKYFAIACLITKLPKDIIEILQHPFVVQILDADPTILETLNCYIDYDFVQLIAKAQQLINELERDVITKQLLTSIKEKIINTLLKQYIINFKRMSLKSLAKLLHQREFQVQELVEKLIRFENLNYIIDPIEMIVIEKYTTEQQHIQQCQQFSNTILKAIDHKYIQALKESIK